MSNPRITSTLRLQKRQWYSAKDGWIIVEEQTPEYIAEIAQYWFNEMRPPLMRKIVNVECELRNNFNKNTSFKNMRRKEVVKMYDQMITKAHVKLNVL